MRSSHAMWMQNLSGPIRLCSAEAAAALVHSGDRLAISANANTPRAFLEALWARAAQLEDVAIMHMRLVGAFPPATPELARHIRLNPLLVSEALRDGVAAGYVDYTPAHFHQISELFASGPRQLDIAVVSVAPPAADGTCSYGTYVGFMEQACQVARLVIAEVNARMPQTYGPARFPLASAAAVIATDHVLPENPRPVITEVERQLGAHVAELIRDGDCLQVGGGAVPAAVAADRKFKALFAPPRRPRRARPSPPARSAARRSTAPRDFRWCWTGAAAWGRVGPLGKGTGGLRPSQNN